MMTKTFPKSILTLGGMLALTASSHAALILSGDFTSHGGTTTSIPSSTVTAGTGVASIDSNVLPFVGGTGDAFLVSSDAASYAVVDTNNNDTTDPIYFEFDFKTSAGPGVTISSASADVTWVTNVGNLQTGTRTFDETTFAIYDESDNLVGSFTSTLGDITVTTSDPATNADKPISYSGTSFNLAGDTTYSLRFTNDAGNNSPGFISFRNFEVEGTVVPEPSSAMLLIGGLGALLFFRRRQKIA